MKKRGKAKQKLGPFTRQKRERFLDVLREGWSENWAMTKVGVSRTKYRSYKNETPEWVTRVDEAKQDGVTALEDEATRRGKRGYVRPVVSGGKVVVWERNFSDKLLSEALKAKSKTYAPSQSTGAHFEDAISGAAEILLGRLTDLVKLANEHDESILAEAESGGSEAPADA